MPTASGINFIEGKRHAANAMKEDRKLCLSSGMNDSLSKPVRPDEIKATIERAANNLSKF
jgi:CheY-like chemotaxis protein